MRRSDSANPDWCTGSVCTAVLVGSALTCSGNALAVPEQRAAPDAPPRPPAFDGQREVEARLPHRAAPTHGESRPVSVEELAVRLNVPAPGHAFVAAVREKLPAGVLGVVEAGCYSGHGQTAVMSAGLMPGSQTSAWPSRKTLTLTVLLLFLTTTTGRTSPAFGFVPVPGPVMSHLS